LDLRARETSFSEYGRCLEEEVKEEMHDDYKYEEEINGF